MFMLSGQPELALVSGGGVVVAAEVDSPFASNSFLQMSLLTVLCIHYDLPFSS